jgi:DNA-binding MltR family transcriptional regulator
MTTKRRKRSTSSVTISGKVFQDLRTFFKHWKKIGPGIQQLSEQGAAIVFTSVVDETLAALLRDFFVNHPKTVDKMLEDPGPLSSFGVRIELAFLLGLITSRERRMLNLIRRIRNDFAHSTDRVSFSQSPIRERSLELDVTIIESQTRVPLFNQKFTTACIYLVDVLWQRTKHIKHQKEPKPIKKSSVELRRLQDQHRTKIY